MFTTFFSAALLIVLAVNGVVADFNIDTISLTQCQSAHFTWGETTGPYNLLIVPSANPCDNAISDLGEHNGNSMTWVVALPAGMNVTASLEDANGDEAWSGAMVVQQSNDTSCVPPSLLASSNLTASSSSASPSPSPSSSSATPRTTLSVPYTGPAASSAAPTSAAGGAVPVGAANAGHDPLGSSASLNIHQLSAPVMVLAAAVACLVLI